MADDGLPVERLRAYLGDLNPQTRALLVRKLEQGALHGAAIPGAAMILEALRPPLRRNPHQSPRLGNPARIFFRPLEPFLLDAKAWNDTPGRIERASLGPLWEWIERDLVPEEARDYSHLATEALLSGDEPRAEVLARPLRAIVAETLSQMLQSAGPDERQRRRIVAQIALPRAVDDLQTLQCVLRHREALDLLGTQLPRAIGNLADEQLDNVLNLVRQAAAGAPDALLPALILIMRRLRAPWQLIRLAIRSAESDLASRVAQSPLALAVTLVFAELRVGVEELRAAFRLGRIDEAKTICKQLHDAIRPLRSELDLSGDSGWSRDLAALRADVSLILNVEIETTPGRLRRLLRPRSVKDIAPRSVLDASEVAETEARIELVAACRRYAGELAINQIASRVHSELQAYFEAGSGPLLESLRGAGHADRPFRQSQVDAAMRFAGKLFGAEYATLFAKAAAMAASERSAVGA